ncbi:hypothetical protein SPONN_2208 [uncultured Candidatus Thioglobus sp.]|nr:hypothetical protein SPONN_2208 [uncultured Candidatus Thioglobus sp.]
MRTITLKTQDDFFNEIGQMALEAHLSKSALIRKAIKVYQKNIERQKIIKQMQKSSFETRNLDLDLKRDFDSTLMDGLEEESLKGWVSDEIIERAMLEIKNKEA